jgi:hypothetical protein
MIRLKTLLATAVAAAALCAMSAAAAAPANAKSRIADFTVTVEGVQKNTWVHDHPGGDGLCDPSVSGSGFETYRFRSRKPLKVRAVLTGGDVELTNYPDGLIEVGTGGKVTRQGGLTWGKIPESECPGGGVPGNLLDKDCGTRAVADLLLVRYQRGRVMLESNVSEPPLGEFRNCDWSGKTWENLLWADARGRRIGQPLTGGELFDFGKNIVIGRGAVTGGHDDGSFKTTIRWEVTVRKLKEYRDPADAGRAPKAKQQRPKKKQGSALDVLEGMLPV